MLKLLERTIDSIEQRLVMIAPGTSPMAHHFRDVRIDPHHHSQLLQAAQRLRGSIYLEDGAIRPGDLSEDGRLQTPEDGRSWHLLMLDSIGRVSACVWYMEHAATAVFDQLRARHTPLASHEHWRSVLWRAVESELARARHHKLRYAEIGGWAVAEHSRCSCEGVLLALAAFSLGRIGNGTLGMTTATVRHASATILRRLGGAPLEADGAAIPLYFDPRYQCQMELLRFDSRMPSRKYERLIDRLKDRLSHVTVLATTPLLGTGPQAWQDAALPDAQWAAA